MVDVSAAATL